MQRIDRWRTETIANARRKGKRIDAAVEDIKARLRVVGVQHGKPIADAAHQGGAHPVGSTFKIETKVEILHPRQGHHFTVRSLQADSYLRN